MWEFVAGGIEAECNCGPSWKTRYIQRLLIRTPWRLGPYLEFVCSYCSRQAFYNPEEDLFMTRVRERQVWDTNEQVQWYKKHCDGAL